jgi:predicted phage baseplate assembly protein
VSKGLDIIQESVDRRLWIALFAAQVESVSAVRATLGGKDERQQQLLSIGVLPTIQVPALFEDIGPRGRVPHVWEVSAGEDATGEPRYVALDPTSDSTAGLTTRGVVRLALPGTQSIAAPANDVRAGAIQAGVGDRPPRLDDPDEAARLVAWVRLRPTERLESMSLSWVGVNAVEIDQRQTVEGRVVGQGDGSADQVVRLPAQSIQPDSFQLQVEEEGRGYQLWQRVDDLSTVGRDAAAYTLDSEAGTVAFGDGIRGKVPDRGRRIRVARMRSGGGSAGNLAAGSLTKISALNVATRAPVTRKLKVTQQVPTSGGQAAETLSDAEKRIPQLFRHRERAVTDDDYQQLASTAPGIRVGRVEVLPRFKPQQRRSNVPGVVSVMALPFKETRKPPNPRPDRPFLEALHSHLDERRPVTTELYVIGCEYISIGLGVGITLRAGAGRNEVIQNVRDALRDYLWPLPPGGPDGSGWPLERSVADRDLEVVIARVGGVRTVAGVNLFTPDGGAWKLLPRAEAGAPLEVTLLPWQLPELMDVVVVVDDEPPTDLRGLPDPYADGIGGVAVPVVPEIC